MAGLVQKELSNLLSKEREWERVMSEAGSTIQGCCAALRERGVGAKLGEKELLKERARKPEGLRSGVKMTAQDKAEGGYAALRKLEVRRMKTESCAGFGKELSKERVRGRGKRRGCMGSGADLVAQGGCLASVIRKLEGNGFKHSSKRNEELTSRVIILFVVLFVVLLI
jgi:hypothetical protein